MSNPPEHDVLKKIDAYYTRRLSEHGATPRGVDWNSEEAQQIRFDQLFKLIAGTNAPSILDYGCGYGAFADYLFQAIADARITGYDVSASMISEARRLYGNDPRCRFTSDLSTAGKHDFVVASGIFSVKMDVTTDEWEGYIFRTLDGISQLAKRGFAFNMLTTYSDADRMRSDLYYADPHKIFDRCRTMYSRNVAILHDYGLYEFTTHVRL